MLFGLKEILPMKLNARQVETAKPKDKPYKMADGFGLHFYEQSSAGKTTTANVAASLYGKPDLLHLT